MNLNWVPGHVERGGSCDGFRKKHSTLVAHHVCTVLHASCVLKPGLGVVKVKTRHGCERSHKSLNRDVIQTAVLLF